MSKPSSTQSPPYTAATALVLLSFLLTPLQTTAYRPWPQNPQKNITDYSFGTSKKYEGSSEFVKLRYHMGPVLTNIITVHTIWYGNWQRNQKKIIREFINSISAKNSPHPSVSGWWKTVMLYTDQTGSNISNTVHLGQEKNDRFYSHDDVYVQDFCTSACGFHYFTFPSLVGYTLPYAWVGNSEKFCAGQCAYPFAVPQFMPNVKPFKSPNGDVGVDGMISVIGHEMAELASNPLANAWYAGGDPSFPVEIADLCEGIYGTGGGGSYTGQVMDGHDGATYNMNGIRRKFLVQWLWSHVLNYCTGPNALDH
ncbi:protein PHOSPHATE-INDUCED [Trifolium repens]|nr:protein PHOSPHATE-INDUCED [Trifolium repens]